MRIFLIITSIILSLNFADAQSIDDTKNYILLKIKKYNIIESQLRNSHTYFEFYKQYLLLKEVIYKKNDEYIGFKYKIIDLKKIKSFDLNDETIDLTELIGKKMVTQNIKIDLGEDFPYCLDLNIDPIQLIDSKIDLYQFHFKCGNPISLNYNNPNTNSDEKQKIKTAFKHLVNLYGGKIIDDLF